MIFHRSVSLPEGSGLPMFGGMAVAKETLMKQWLQWGALPEVHVSDLEFVLLEVVAAQIIIERQKKDGNYPISRQTHLDHVVQCHVADAFKLGQSRFGKLRSFALTGRDFFHVRG